MNQRKVVTDLIDNTNRRRILPGELKVVNGTSDWDLVTLGYTSQLPPTEVGGLFLSSVVKRLKADSLPKDSVLRPYTFYTLK